MSPLRPRLLVRVVLLVLAPLVPLLGLVLFTDLTQRREAASEARATALRLAQAVAVNQAELIEDTHQLLATLAKDPRLRPDDETACNVYLADTRQRWPRFANLGVIAPDGRIRCSALPFSPGLDLSDRLYFEQAVATRAFAVGEYQIGRITGKATLNFGYPLLAGGGRVTGVVFAALDLAWLNTLAEAADLSPGTTILVVDRNGVILTRHPDPERWIGRPGFEEPLVRAVVAGEEGTSEEVGLDGVERFYGFVPLTRSSGATPVYVTAGIPKSAALAGAERRLERDLAALGLLAALAALVGWLGGRVLVVRPVERRERALRERVSNVAAFAERLASGGENGSLTEAILTGMADSAGADVGAVYLTAGRDEALALAGTRGLDAGRVQDRLAPGEGRAGRALAERRTLSVSHEGGDVRLVVLGAELPVRHELYLPLLQGRRPLGVVVLGRVDTGPFTAEERDLLGLLAAQAGAALSKTGPTSG